ncbi:TonB-dependent receptor [Sphingobacterium psychroaquaticum]|uniref:Outer membrane receptor for ferrienterochelin and colicins n=1 Tax=Sphingobacterium psychroaquaticum TaxID=561061 RepID=A0A1X7K1V5_9SPHI|nr:TonB-dependent receptor [Sphingobacterium psychroaquaticum]SMG34635.1 outer membrane receptor for ferrienterochelin and colicins [Sphingobacterium psychroaquaticum]
MTKTYFWLLITLLYIFPITLFSQVTLKGKVTDANQAPIAQATILVDGTKLGTSTDNEGFFTLSNVPTDKSTLTTRAVGYQSSKRTLNPKEKSATITIVLNEDNLSLNEVVVSATRYGLERREAPVVVNVLGPKLFNATQSVAMSETLNYQPGVRVENNCQNCGFSQVRLNGMQGAYSQILINSRSVFSALNSVYGLDQIPTSMIDRIEVVRSGGSALFGANAIAGTINIITKDPVENDWQIKSTNSLIDGKSWDNTIDFNTSYVDTDLRNGVTFYGMHRNREAWDANDDGFSEITKLRNTTFGTKAFFKPSEYNKITLDMSVLNEFRRGGDRLNLAPHFTDVTEQLQTNSLIGGLTYDQYSKDWKQKLSLYVSAQKTKRDSYYGGLAGSTSHQDSVTAANSYGVTDDFAMVAGAQYTYNFDKDVFTAGVEFNSNRTEDNIPAYNRMIDQKTNALGAYAQYEWKIVDQLKALIGARYDYTHVDGTYQLLDKNRISDQNFGTFSPRLTILYDIDSYLQFRGGYARGFRAPQAFNEDMHVTSIGGQQAFVLMGENLKTEYSNAYTGSFNYTRNFGRTQASLLIEGFYTDLKNPFTNVMTSEEDDIIMQEMRNGAGSKVYGSNIELSVAPSSKFSVQAGGTIQRSKFNEEQIIFEGETAADNVVTKRYMRTPNMYGYLNTNIKATKQFAIDVTGVYTGKMLVPHVQESGQMLVKEARDFAELNLRLGYTVAIKKEFSMEFFGGVQNMFNAFQKDFDRGALRDSNYIYGPTKPRTFTLGVKIGHFH